MHKRFFAAALLFSVPFFAQVPSTSEVMEVRLIEVPVTVVDAAGNPVRGLKPENFEIYDEGKKQQITVFDITDRGQPAAQAATISPAARRNFLVLFDMSNATPASLLRAREAASQFVMTQALPGDRISVATISSQRGIRFLTAFTTDRALVNSAVDTLGAPTFFSPGDPLMLTQPETPAPPTIESSGNREAAIREFIEELTAMSQKSNNDVARINVERSLAAIAELGMTLDRVGGRKHVVLLSEGFDPKMLHGRDSLSSAEAQQDRTNLERGEWWRVDTDNFYGNTRSTSELRFRLDRLRYSDVVLHAIDIKGLRSNVDARDGAKPVSNEALFLLTRDTGGRVFKNTNDLSEEFARFMKSQEVTYTLGFNARRTSPGKFHRLSVKVNGVPGARAWYRLGYNESNAPANAIDRTIEASEIVMNMLPVEDVKFTAFAAALPEKKNRQPVPIVLDVEGRSILDNAIGETAFVEIFAYAFSQDELIRGFLHQRMSFDLTKVRPQLASRGMKYYGTMNLSPGDYSLRILVRAGKQNGFASIPLTVPDYDDQYVAPPLLFSDTAGWLMVRTPLSAGSEYPFVIGERSFVPATLPVLKAGSPRELALFLYNVPVEGLRVRAGIESGGTTADLPISIVGRTSPDQNGGVKLLLELRPHSAPLGAGRLHVTLGGTAGTEAQQVSIPLRIE